MKKTNNINPLRVYVVWDNLFVDGIKYAKLVYNLICRPINQPSERGIGIPVEFIKGIQDEYEVLKLQDNRYNLIFILIDDNLLFKKGKWNQYLKKITELKGEKLIIPIAFDCTPFGVLEVFNNTNYVVLPKTNKTEYFEFTLSYEVSRALNHIRNKQSEIKLFLSHTKSTGEKIVEKVRGEILRSTKLNTFYDKHDIPYGDRFDLKIYESIKDSIVIVFLTDGFSSRDWCKKEIIAAKELGEPIILLDFYEEGETRLFPYLGNVRVISLDYERIRYNKLLTAILLEFIKVSYYRLHTLYLIKLLSITNIQYEIMSLHPELLTVISHKNDNKLYIYPEPPVSSDEIKIIEKVVDSNKYSTPIMFSIINSKLKDELSDLSVGISVSYSEDENEINQLKLQDIITNITRYLLSLNAIIYYAGNPNFEENLSFSSLMLNVENKYYKNTHLKNKGLCLVLSNYISNSIPVKQLNQITQYAEIIYHKKKGSTIEIDEDLTLTRNVLIERINSHILFGGKIYDYAGRLPGILEEFLISIKIKKPIFIIGGFGGASKLISNILIKNYLSDIPKDFETVLNFGISDLNNGLSINENKILFESQDSDTIVAIILKGLKNIKQGLSDLH